MSYEVYPEDFHTRFEVTHAISIMETVNYKEVGTLQLTVDASDYNIEALRVGNIVYDTDIDAAFVVVGVKYDTVNNLIVANAKTAEELLNRRVCWYPKTKIRNVETGIYDLITNNLRGLPRVVLASAKGFSEQKDLDEDGNPFEPFGGQLLDVVDDILADTEIGRRMVWDAESLRFTFELYKGDDLTEGIHAVPFSDEQGTAKDLVITENDSESKTAAFVACRYKNDEKTVAVVQVDPDNIWDYRRREVWIDSGINQEADESYAAVLARATEYGRAAIVDYRKRTTFQISIDPDELGKIYKLGDMITCSAARFGYEFKARIIGIKYTLGYSGQRTEIVLGDPILTVMEALKRK